MKGITKTHVRVKATAATAKAYAKFKKDAVEEFNLGTRSFGGYTELTSPTVDINSFSGKDYLYMIVYSDKKKTSKVLDLLVMYFEEIEYSE